MKKILLFFLFAIPVSGFSQDEQQIMKILQHQVQSWNRGNLDSFMVGYWENDSLMYIGKSGATYGYRPALERYKTNYSDKEKMGQLKYDILQIKRLSPEYYFVVGKWFLNRSVGDIGGHFTLLFRKINGNWRIVVDHSS